ncbi:hypothetical protein GT347_03860 [Xylophilus rhododendri]|uniref:DUF2917 domain-containing protein n=1 Tax=Xylophilus rhododendri TaxID=2697032 RepID=A0A857J223_9BURK|nr:hypothetical protein [Xylophilus rhododendri]QHI97189.1 hypothetical protein GT347_03860 [Xylophilus rhododendri]
MSLNNPLLQSIAAHQEQLIHLETGSEVRCVAGSLRLQLVHEGLAMTLSAGQATRVPAAQWVALEGLQGARFSVQCHADEVASQPVLPVQQGRAAQAGIWHTVAAALARLTQRRGPRTA